MRKEWQSPPKWRLIIYQLIWRNTSHDMNLHQERCANHKSRYISPRFLKLSFGQFYSSNILLVTESYNEETPTWDVTENVFTAIHIVVFSSYDWRTTKWEKAFRILLQASQCERQQKLPPKSLASVLWKCTSKLYVRHKLSFWHLRSSGLMRSADSLPNQTSLRRATNHTSEDHYTAEKALKRLHLSQDALISRLPASAQVIEKVRSSNYFLSCIGDVSGSNLDHETDCPIVFHAPPQILQVNERTPSQIRPWLLWIRQWTFRFHKRTSCLAEKISAFRGRLCSTQ